MNLGASGGTPLVLITFGVPPDRAIRSNEFDRFAKQNRSNSFRSYPLRFAG
jgi:hypothetical protein